jgi:rhodanese-related sulfurtransferase
VTTLDPAVPQIEPGAAREMVAAGAVLVDVRELDEWQAGHAPQAQHAPLSTHATAGLAVDPNSTVLVICRSGRRSDDAAAALRATGVDARNVARGMHGWVAAGGEIVDSAGNPGTVI